MMVAITTIGSVLGSTIIPIILLLTLYRSYEQLGCCLSADTPLKQILSLEVGIWQQQEKARAVYQGSDFAEQQASMLIQVYRKGVVWRISNVAQGFNGGLAFIVEHFGGEVEDSTAQTSSNAAKVSLEKIMLDKAPKLVNLAKKATMSLEKRQLQNLTAKVALVSDATGSMNRQYREGDVQEVVNRILPLAISFDDDQQLDCW